MNIVSKYKRMKERYFFFILWIIFCFFLEFSRNKYLDNEILCMFMLVFLIVDFVKSVFIEVCYVSSFRM